MNGNRACTGPARIIAFTAALLCMPALAADKVITILAEDAAEPWSYADGTGFANDVVVAAFREMNVAVRLSAVPYARCKQEVLQGSVPACFSMTWLPEFEGQVWLSPAALLEVSADVFEQRDKPLPRPATGLCQLPMGSVAGVVRGYEYPAPVMALAEHGATLEEATNDQLNLLKLAAGRLGAVIVMTNALEPRNIKAVRAGVSDKVRFAFHCGHETGTIGFSVRHSEGAWARDTFEAGYRRIRENGVLQRIDAVWRLRLAKGE
jgi:ABC-type amino acid transport substrate-binding protein